MILFQNLVILLLGTIQATLSFFSTQNNLKIKVESAESKLEIKDKLKMIWSGE